MNERPFGSPTDRMTADRRYFDSPVAITRANGRPPRSPVDALPTDRRRFGSSSASIITERRPFGSPDARMAKSPTSVLY